MSQLKSTLSVLILSMLCSELALAGSLCESAHKEMGFDSNSIKARCASAIRDSHVKSESFRQCLRTLSKDERGSALRPLCLAPEFAKKFSEDPMFTSCVSRSTETLGDFFWFLDDFVYFEQKINESEADEDSGFWGYFFKPAPKYGSLQLTFFQEKVLKSCSNPFDRAGAPSPVHARVLGQKHFHTLTGQRGTTIMLGGFSDLWSEGQRLLSVSDDLYRPTISTFEWSFSQAGQVDFKYVNTKQILPQVIPMIDFEGMVVLPNGNFLLSSEIPLKLKEQVVASEDSFLIEVNADGQFVSGHPLKSEYVPLFRTHVYPCPKNKIDVPLEGLAPVENNPPAPGPKECRSTSQVGGFYHNKGIEALALDSSGTKIIYGSEEPFFFGRSWSDKIPMVVQELAQPTNQTIYKYPINVGKGNGLVALRHLVGGKYISMERGFDSRVGEASVKLFVFEFPISPAQTIRKSLVLDLSELRSQFSNGFEAIDNFEGLAVGPETEKGRLFFLVSDNNFSKKQKSSLIAIEIDREVLQ